MEQADTRDFPFVNWMTASPGGNSLRFPPLTSANWRTSSLIRSWMGSGVLLWFVSWELPCTPVPLVSQNPNPKSTNLAGSLDGSPIHNTNSTTKALSRHRSILQRFIHTVGIRCFLSIHRLQCDCDCDLRAPCAAAVQSHNTTPPLRPRRGLPALGGRHMVASEEPAWEHTFWTSTCAGYRSIIVVKVHTLSCKSCYICHQRVIHTLCSTSPRLCLGRSFRRQLRQPHCTGAVPTARLWARRTITYHNIGHSHRSWMPSRHTTNRLIHLSIRQDILRPSTPLMASRLSHQPLLGIQTCRISYYLASRLVESAVLAPRERG